MSPWGFFCTISSQVSRTWAGRDGPVQFFTLAGRVRVVLPETGRHNLLELLALLDGGVNRLVQLGHELHLAVEDFGAAGSDRGREECECAPRAWAARTTFGQLATLASAVKLYGPLTAASPVQSTCSLGR